MHTSIVANRLPAALGFARPIHFLNWLLFSGTLFIFSVISLRFLYFTTVFCGGGSDGALPGECFYFLRTLTTRLSMKVHLWCVLPAGILASLQFLPALRRPARLRIHRGIGYASIALALVGNLAAVPSIRHAFGGDLASQVCDNFIPVAVNHRYDCWLCQY
ncbi:hypothetical protein NUW58_g2219 [Xylaria curta]|uniref:Uncharacterized protein n=1 Tax=Xylaria curta TaxID=42375 RepID=A0ACC1PJG1_9PEZI|nr:hypothetical protein NUW58_g2219 [Xylaria curta]